MNKTGSIEVAQPHEKSRLSLAGLRGPGLALLVLALVLVPFLAPTPFIVGLVNELLIVALFAVSLDILAGYAGLVSFGHAAFYGLGAYSAGLLLLKASPSLWLAVAGTVIVVALFSVLIGFLCVRAPGIAFAMLTLAFAQMFYTIFWKWRSFTGGSDGLTGIPRPELALGGFGISLQNRSSYYFFTLAVVVICFFLIGRLVNSPMGRVLQGIRENEERLQFIGFNARTYKVIAFAISGTFGGVAGALYAMFAGFVAPDLMHWSASGNVLMMTIIGGMGTIVGPIVGATGLLMLQHFLSSYFEQWTLVLGTLIIIFVLAVPGGVVGFLRERESGGRD